MVELVLDILDGSSVPNEDQYDLSSEIVDQVLAELQVEEGEEEEPES